MSTGNDETSPISEAVTNEGHPGVVQHVIELIQGQGLTAIIEKFKSQGFEHVIASWVGTGENLPISADQLKSIFSNEQLSAISSKLGVDTGQLLGHLSSVLPSVVDKLTPGGKLPDSSVLQQSLGRFRDLVGGMLGGRSSEPAAAPPPDA